MLILSNIGKKSQVLSIKCKSRSGDKNFVSCINSILREAYPNECIGLGGVFCVAKGKLKIHVMPKFSEVIKYISTEQELHVWIYFPLNIQLVSYIMLLTCFILQTPLKSDKDVEGWLNFYEMDAPFTCLSVMVSRDPVSKHYL